MTHFICMTCGVQFAALEAPMMPTHTRKNENKRTA